MNQCIADYGNQTPSPYVSQIIAIINKRWLWFPSKKFFFNQERLKDVNLNSTLTFTCENQNAHWNK